MSKRHRAERLSDPRTPGGDVAGPGGPATMNGVVVDTTKAVLLDGSTGVLVHLTRGGREEGDGFGLMLEGRINKTQDRSRVLYLMDIDGLVAVAAECVSLADRAGQHQAFLDAFDAQIASNRSQYEDDL